MYFVTWTTTDRSVSILTYITNRWPKALVSAKILWSILFAEAVFIVSYVGQWWNTSLRNEWLTSKQAGIKPSSVQCSAYSFKSELSKIKDWQVEVRFSCCKYPKWNIKWNSVTSVNSENCCFKHYSNFISEMQLQMNIMEFCSLTRNTKLCCSTKQSL